MERPTYYDEMEEVTVPYATEEEVLEFANKLRAAGGADALEGLFPAKQSQANACLIAKALNFGCEVDSSGTHPEAPDESQWLMRIDGMHPDNVRELAAAVDCEVRSDKYSVELLLPRLIGNAAGAFDHALEPDAWVAKYREQEETA